MHQIPLEIIRVKLIQNILTIDFTVASYSNRILLETAAVATGYEETRCYSLSLLTCSIDHINGIIEIKNVESGSHILILSPVILQS